MIKSLQFFLWLAIFYGCFGESHIAKLMDDEHQPLCANSENNCLVFTDNVSHQGKEFYLISNNEEGYHLSGCNEGEAMRISGNKSLRPGIVPIKILKDQYHVEKNPFIACPNNEGKTPVHSGFDLSDPVLKDLNGEFYYAKFGETTYFKLAINKCGPILNSWQINSSRLILTITNEPSRLHVKRLYCQSDSAGSGGSDQTGWLTGWSIVKIDAICDLSYFKTWESCFEETEENNPASTSLYVAIYKWRSGEPTFFAINKIVHKGRTFDAWQVIDGHDIAPEKIATVEGALSDLFRVKGKIPFVDFESNTFEEISKNLFLAPIVTINLDTTRPIDLRENSIALGIKSEGSELVDFFKPLEIESEKWSEVAFSDGAQALAMESSILDHRPIVWDDPIETPTPKRYQILYLFEQCKLNFNTDGSLQRLIQRGPKEFILDADRSILFKRRESLREYQKNISMEKYDAIIKFPCLKPVSCSLEIDSFEELKMLTMGESELPQGCNRESVKLTIGLKKDIKIVGALPDNLALEIKRANLRTLLPNLDEIELTGIGEARTITDHCYNCGKSLTDGCSGSTAIAAFSFLGFSKITLSRLTIKLGNQKSFKYPRDGISVKDTDLVLNGVRLLKSSSNSDTEITNQYRKGICTKNAKVFMYQTQTEGDLSALWAYGSFLSLAGTVSETNNPNLYIINDTLEFFPKEDLSGTNSMKLVSTGAQGRGIYLEHSSGYAINTTVKVIDDAILIGNQTEFKSFGLNLFGPMITSSDEFASEKPGGKSKGIYIYRNNKTRFEFHFSRLIGFKTGIYFPYGASRTGMNEVAVFESLVNPRKTNGRLSNVNDFKRIGKLLCSGNCSD